MAGADVRQDPGHVQIAVAGANLGEGFVRAEAATAAAANVVAAEQSPLCAGELFQHLAHGGMGADVIVHERNEIFNVNIQGLQ